MYLSEGSARVVCCALAAWFGLLAGSASAATFCVSSPSDLQAALATAAFNNQSDIINLVEGTYVIPAALVHHATENEDLYLFGGYAPGCSGLAYTGAKSIIDGSGNRRLLDFSTRGAVTLLRMGWQNGISTATGNAFIIFPQNSATANLRIVQNVFRNIDGYADSNVWVVPIYAGANGLVDIEDNLFTGIVSKQPGRNAIRLRSGNYSGTYAGRFINSTVTGNVVLHAATLNEGTLTLDGNQTPWLAASNLMWGNSGDYDLGLQISTSLHNNDIGAYKGAPIDGIGTNPSVDPQFVDAPNHDFHLNSTSPLRDAGMPSVPGGIFLRDLDDNPRVQFGAADIGAYEIQQLGDLIFANGFDSQ